MKGYSKLSRFLGGCLLQFIPLFLQAQPVPIPPVRSFTAVPPVKALAPPSSVRGLENEVPSSGMPKAALEIDRIEEVLDFWFGFPQGPEYFPDDKMDIWFAGTPEIERQIRDNFFQDVMNAGRGEYNNWRETPRGRLALILLLDQFPRHIYRNKPQAFAFDRMAQALAIEGIQKGDDKFLYPIERAFFYLPLEHSEDIGMQNLSVASYRQLVADSPVSIKPQMEDFLQAAITHQQQIVRFGRFPYRNAVLGRETNPQETVFLMQWSKKAL